MRVVDRVLTAMPTLRTVVKASEGSRGHAGRVGRFEKFRLPRPRKAFRPNGQVLSDVVAGSKPAVRKWPTAGRDMRVARRRSRGRRSGICPLTLTDNDSVRETT